MCSIMGYCDCCAAPSLFKQGFDQTISRGPDDSRIVDTGRGLLGFHRLAIMGLTPEGMQPFELDGSYVVCNGEIYGFEARKRALQAKGYAFSSGSDCEILLPMYREYGTDMFAMLDAEFALILFDARTQEYVAARDPIGIRPLYYGRDARGVMVFASEPKNLTGMCAQILPFPPGCYWKDGRFVRYADPAHVDAVCRDDLDTVCKNIRGKLIAGVEKRLVADARVGFLLSGGLDSSLVCAIAARRSEKPIRTFAIGMREDAIDLKYAREAAQYIGSCHTEVLMTREQVLSELENVVRLLGTYDITTIRASMGMYLLCKWIHENTDISARGAKAHSRAAHVRRAARRPLHFHKLAGGARALWRSGFCEICDEHRSRKEAEPLWQGQVSAAPRLRGRLSAACAALPREGGLLRCGGTFDGRRSQGLCGDALYGRGI